MLCITVRHARLDYSSWGYLTDCVVSLVDIKQCQIHFHICEAETLSLLEAFVKTPQR
jgi:hypothetical protein